VIRSGINSCWQRHRYKQDEGDKRGRIGGYNISPGGRKKRKTTTKKNEKKKKEKWKKKKKTNGSVERKTEKNRGKEENKK